MFFFWGPDTYITQQGSLEFTLGTSGNVVRKDAFPSSVSLILGTSGNAVRKDVFTSSVALIMGTSGNIAKRNVELSSLALLLTASGFTLHKDVYVSSININLEVNTPIQRKNVWPSSVDGFFVLDGVSSFFNTVTGPNSFSEVGGLDPFFEIAGQSTFSYFSPPAQSARRVARGKGMLDEIMAMLRKTHRQVGDGRIILEVAGEQSFTNAPAPATHMEAAPIPALRNYNNEALLLLLQ